MMIDRKGEETEQRSEYKFLITYTLRTLNIQTMSISYV